MLRHVRRTFDQLSLRAETLLLCCCRPSLCDARCLLVLVVGAVARRVVQSAVPGQFRCRRCVTTARDAVRVAALECGTGTLMNAHDEQSFQCCVLSEWHDRDSHCGTAVVRDNETPTI